MTIANNLIFMWLEVNFKMFLVVLVAIMVFVILATLTAKIIKNKKREIKQ